MNNGDVVVEYYEEIGRVHEMEIFLCRFDPAQTSFVIFLRNSLRVSGGETS